MSKRKTVLKLSVIFLILLGLYVGVSAKQMDAANQVTGLYYDGPRMDVVRFRELLEVHSNPLEPGEARALKIDNETNLPMSTVLLTSPVGNPEWSNQMGPIASILRTIPL